MTVEILDRDDGDGELAERARRGDREAFGRLFEQHRPMLMAVCRRALEGYGGVDEVLQDTAVAALLGIARLRDPERFGSWLVGIGLNLCRRRLRDRARSRSGATLPGGIWLDRWTADESDPAIIAEERELRVRIARAIAGLPRGQRDAILGFYVAGLTYAETASSLGIAVGAVKTRLYKARERLRAQFSSEGKEWVMRSESEGGTVEMRLADVLRLPAEDDGSPEWVIVLEEVGGERRLPIWVGEAEATWVAMALEGTELPRPGPYMMVRSLLDAVGSRVREIRIERLVEATYFATIELESTAGRASIDARPSDALNVAALTGSGITATTDVLADAELGRDEPLYRRLKQALATDGLSSSTIAAEAKEHWERSVAQFAERRDRDT